MSNIRLRLEQCPDAAESEMTLMPKRVDFDGISVSPCDLPRQQLRLSWTLQDLER